MSYALLHVTYATTLAAIVLGTMGMLPAWLLQAVGAGLVIAMTAVVGRWMLRMITW